MKRITLLLVLVCGCANATKDGGGGNVDGNPGGNDAPATKDASIEAMAHQSHGFVAGGVVAASAHYKLVGTLNAASGTAASVNYHFHGGVLGSTQP